MKIELSQTTRRQHVTATWRMDTEQRNGIDLPNSGDRVLIGLTPAVCMHRSDGTMKLQPENTALHVPGPWKLHGSQQSGHLMLGPVIGILSSRYLHGRKRPVAGPVGRFRRIISEARSMGALAFVFAPSGIRWKNRTITGYTYIHHSSGRRWVLGTFPFPNVVYNRIPTRRDELRPSAKAATQRLESIEGLHLFNPRFLNKWQVFRALQKTGGADEYLPATTPLSSTSAFMDFIKQHRRVYLKQNQGSLGIGTVCAEMIRDGRIRWRATKGQRAIHTRIMTGNHTVGQSINRLSRKRKYLMQAAVPLLKTGGRPFDVRALVQKEFVEDGSTRWRVTGMAARIAGRGQITTHRPRGGSRGHLETLIQSIFPSERAREVTSNLRRAIEQCATAFDEATGNAHGELSLDVGLDQEGHPWVLEINAKPMVFDEPAIRGEARRRLIKYCIDLSGFGVNAAEQN